MSWPSVQVRHICRLQYGDSLPAGKRADGNVMVYGSNGPVGTHDHANTQGPVIIVGRKGSYGKLHYSAEPVFAIDTTYFIDKSCTKADLRWLYHALSVLELDRLTFDVGVPGLSRDEAYGRRISLPPAEVQPTVAKILGFRTFREA